VRLKICGNPDCERLFFDTSKNRTGRWCDEACGNRMRVRRFRAARAE
jgi:predicted RNA-binding Zn ribbon-like protein